MTKGSVPTDVFRADAVFEDIVALHDFDARLRIAAFAGIAAMEPWLRAGLGHELGRVSPTAHEEPNLLGPAARSGDTHRRWFQRYEQLVRDSREEFVQHHRAAYGGHLPVWAAVEVLDWGGLSRLYAMSPRPVQDAVAAPVGLNGPQLSSWMKSLNIVRNVCAHHGRFFNRVFALQPRMPRAEVCGCATDHLATNRSFGQLTLLQHLLAGSGAGPTTPLPAVMRTFPADGPVPPASMGRPRDWDLTTHWNRCDTLR